MINAIIFDLGNVIVKVDWGNFYEKLAEHSGKPIGFIKKYHQNSADSKNFEKGKINFKQFYGALDTDLNLKIGQNEFNKYYCSIFTLNNNVANLIQKLKRKFRLVLLSNTDKLHFEFINNKFRIVNAFDDCVLSYEVGYRKPNPLIFINAIKKTKTLPFNCAYFDDIMEFVFIARLTGIKAFQYRTYAKLINDLGKVGVSAKGL